MFFHRNDKISLLYSNEMLLYRQITLNNFFKAYSTFKYTRRHKKKNGKKSIPFYFQNEKKVAVKCGFKVIGFFAEYTCLKFSFLSDFLKKLCQVLFVGGKIFFDNS